MALTDIAIRSAKPKNKAYRLSDAGSLYLEVSPSGGKLWRFKYRFNDREKRLALGVYPTITLKDARERRDDAKRLLAASIDPGAAKKAAKYSRAGCEANSFEVVAREWHSQRSASWVANHGNRILKRLEADLFPFVGRTPIADLKAPDFLDAARRIEARGANETARRAINTCSQVMRFAMATGRANADPTTALRGALAPVQTKHLASVTDPKAVAELLRVIDGYHGGLIVRGALRLAPLVFVRPGELRQAKWSDIDLDNSEWRFTASKTKTPHIVPLASQAVAILREMHCITGNGAYVFPSARSADRPMSDNAILGALRRLGIGNDEMTGHGFRAMARTILDEVLGFRPDFIEHQLAHAVRDPNGRAYNRTAHLGEQKKMMQEWADYLDSICRTAAPAPINHCPTGDSPK
jgi:integrase